MRDLTAENAVTASLNLYRKRFKTYFKLSIISHLWFLIPIYGWAKCYAGIALISRLAFSEITGKPETISEAQSHINQNLWSFWLAAILVYLCFGFRAFLWVIVWSISTAVLSFLSLWFLGNLVSINQAFFAVSILIFLVLMVLAYAYLFLKLIEIYSPFFGYELPLAIEPKMTSSTTITRSRRLVEGLRRSVVKTIVVAVLATIPISFLSLSIWVFVSGFIQNVTSTNTEQSTATAIRQVIWVIYWSIFNMVITPFWQTLKAMVYYNLLCQKEAVDLPKNLASSPCWDAGDFREIGSES